jgi:hypothetical protein
MTSGAGSARFLGCAMGGGGLSRVRSTTSAARDIAAPNGTLQRDRARATPRGAQRGAQHRAKARERGRA